MNYKDELIKPVLFLVFNRPEKTQQVFEAIKEARPRKLYVAADAPRLHVPDDEEKCRRVRDIVSEINWDCDAKFLFHETNLGCSIAGLTAWNWIFEHEKEMIFLEDDGVPSKSFFWFCQEMLDRYENNLRVNYICGQNFGEKYGNATYFFSKYGGTTWGMATWKRTHEIFEYKLESYEATKNLKSFRDTFLYNFEFKYQTKRFEDYIKFGANTYDLQITYMTHKYDMLTINPNINLVTNIGYDLEAANNVVTPDSRITRKYGHKPKFELNVITHPEKVEVDIAFEKKQLMHRVFQDKPKLRVLMEIYLPMLANSIKKIVRMYRKL